MRGKSKHEAIDQPPTSVLNTTLFCSGNPSASLFNISATGLTCDVWCVCVCVCVRHGLLAVILIDAC